MALVQCKECGKDISPKATACPHCGHPAAKKKGGCGPIILLSLVGTIAVTALFQDEQPMQRPSTLGSSETKHANPRQVPEASEALIPRSTAGDSGKYYLLKKTRHGEIVRATHKRVGIDSVVYTITETDCENSLMREIGYSEISEAAIRESPTKWFELVPGSSKSDLAAFVCKP